MEITRNDPLGLTSLTKADEAVIFANHTAVLNVLHQAGLNNVFSLLVLMTAITERLTDINDPALRLFGMKIVTEHLEGAIKASVVQKCGAGMN